MKNNRKLIVMADLHESVLQNAKDIGKLIVIVNTMSNSIINLVKENKAQNHCIVQLELRIKELEKTIVN